MSGRIKAARGMSQGRAMPGTGYLGDPGLFGFLGKVVKKIASPALSFLPGGSMITGFAQTAAAKIFGSKRPSRGFGSASKEWQRIQSGQLQAGDLGRLRQAGQRLGTFPLGPGPAQLGGRGGFPGMPQAVPYPGQAVKSSGTAAARAAAAANGLACPAGYHPNTSEYAVRSPMGTLGMVAVGSRCVKNRRRNPLNPRAFDRAFSRIKSAKNFSKTLGRITIREKC